VSIAVDNLQIPHTPEIEERRPRNAPVLAPHAEERDPMVDLSSFPKPETTFGTASLLQALEQLNLIAGGRP
jgi:hypothetical protein